MGLTRLVPWGWESASLPRRRDRTVATVARAREGKETVSGLGVGEGKGDAAVTAATSQGLLGGGLEGDQCGEGGSEGAAKPEQKLWLPPVCFQALTFLTGRGGSASEGTCATGGCTWPLS